MAGLRVVQLATEAQPSRPSCSEPTPHILRANCRSVPWGAGGREGLDHSCPLGKARRAQHLRGSLPPHRCHSCVPAAKPQPDPGQQVGIQNLKPIRFAFMHLIPKPKLPQGPHGSYRSGIQSLRVHHTARKPQESLHGPKSTKNSLALSKGEPPLTKPNHSLPEGGDAVGPLLANWSVEPEKPQRQLSLSVGKLTLHVLKQMF